MTTIRAILKRHPAMSYFVAAFAISWGGILAIVLPSVFPAPQEQVDRIFLPVYLAMLAGPSLAGTMLTAAIDGVYGLRRLWSRLTRWRVAGVWYAMALATAPVILLVVTFVLMQFSPAFVPSIFGDTAGTSNPIHAPNAMAFLLMGVGVGAGAGFFEEIGWTGFATPRLVSRHGATAAALLIGVLWGAWHFLAILWGSVSAIGDVPVVLYLCVALFSFLPPYRLLMTWVYERTESLLIAVLMHASLTGSMLVLGSAVSGRSLLVFDLVFAAALWLVVGGVAISRSFGSLVSAEARPSQ